MSNYTKENLLSLTPANVPAGTLAMKVGDEVFTAGNTVIEGTDVSATTATAEGVAKGLKFFNAYGTLTTGTLEVAGSSGSGEFYKCTEVRMVEPAAKYIIVTGGSYDTITGTYILEDLTQTGINRKWVHVDNPLCSIYFDKTDRTWVLFCDELNIRLVESSAANNPVDNASWQDMNNASNENLPQFAWNTLPDIAWEMSVLELVEATPGKRKWHIRGGDSEYSYLEENPWGDTEHPQLGYVPKWGLQDKYFSSTETDAPWEISVWDDPTSSAYKYQELQLAPLYKEAQQQGEWSGQRAVLKVDTREVQTDYYDIELDFDGEFTHEDLATTFLHGGRFELLNPDLKGTDRIYRGSAGWYIKYRNGAWQIYQPNVNGSSLIGPKLVSTDPIGTGWDMSGSNLTHLNGTYIKTTKFENSGTKTELFKYYDFEDTVTNGLSWGNGLTPVVDGVYDAEVMVRVAVYTAGQYPEIASPMDMTGYTKDEWVVSESDYRFDITKAWNGFYPSGIWAGDDWLQWQNTAQQVLIRQLTFGYRGNSNWIYKCRLDGSDDGEHWTEIGTRDCEYDDEYNTILTFPDNNTAYYYHRLVVLSSNGCAVVEKLLAKRDIDGRNTP